MMNDQALKVALAAVEQLPLKHQKLLVERLVSATVLRENTTVVYLRRLAPEKQIRLAELMDKNNNHQLRRTEQSELDQLGDEVDQILLDNSQALAYALRPELFDQQGRPIKSRFRQAMNGSSSRRAKPSREDA
jgi:hypothetical protein